MKYNDQTDMGGVGEAFLTTHWSLMEKVTTSADDKNQALISLLLEKYWKPVYCYLRHKGYGNEEAKDLTQGFFHEVVLGRELFQKADQSKGRFRTYLLIALSRYLINVRYEETAQKRIPRHKILSLDQACLPDLPQTITESTPEDSFDYAWVSALLEQVLQEVETKCHEEGKALHWRVFHDRVLQPTFERMDPPPMKEICDRYGIENGIKASSMIVTVKRRFRAVLGEYVRNSVTSDEEVGDELKEIMRFFPGFAQYSR
jgi:RNA polymerase sigma-70 factor (ECF subfamily)